MLNEFKVSLTALIIRDCQHKKQIKQDLKLNLKWVNLNLTIVFPPCEEETGINIRGPFERFVDSPYYSESDHCGGSMTVSSSKYLPRQAMHFL
jgi:hypothetical protein